MNAFRLRLWTGNTDTSLSLAAEAQSQNMTVIPVLFLSDDWADYVKQPIPEAWRHLRGDTKLAAVRDYAQVTAAALKHRGVRGNLYAVGNEIDFGICGEFEERWDRRFSLEWMRHEVWPKAAAVIVAAQQGILAVNPEARFIVHLTQWWNPEYCQAMLSTLRAHGVKIDVVGLSYYPSAPMSEERSMTVFFKHADFLGQAFSCPVIICEFAYPATAQISGQFSDWNRPVAGYPLTTDGQNRWLADFLAGCRRDTHILGAFYWSPEWNTEALWKAFSLFDESGVARPALDAFVDRNRL